MPRKNHEEIIKKGVSYWNNWRKQNKNIKPLLRGVRLSNLDLSNVDFVETNLIGAILAGTQLNRAIFVSSTINQANFSKANLSDANFMCSSASSANFKGADLTRTDFTEVGLVDSDLSDTQFINSSLYGANLHNANLSNANLKETFFGRTILGNTNLRSVKNIEHANHVEPSIIDHRTIAISESLPVTFLRGCGLSDDLIEYYRFTKATLSNFYKCFISFTEADDEISEKLYNNLQDKGIRCWRWKEDAKIGQTLLSSIDQAVRDYDKLIVICSKDSLQSPVVLREIERALQKEDMLLKQDKVNEVLFPIRLDDFVFDKWQHYRKADVIQKNIGDFRNWKNSKSYESALERLVRDLKIEQ